MAEVANSKLLQNIEGIQKVKDALVVLVKTEWNAAIVDELERGCKNMLGQYGVLSKTIIVPGGKLWIMENADGLWVKDEKGTMAQITIKDVHQSNGIIHVIDTVLMPQ